MTAQPFVPDPLLLTAGVRRYAFGARASSCLLPAALGEVRRRAPVCAMLSGAPGDDP